MPDLYIATALTFLDLLLEMIACVLCVYGLFGFKPKRKLLGGIVTVLFAAGITFSHYKTGDSSSLLTGTEVLYPIICTLLIFGWQKLRLLAVPLVIPIPCDILRYVYEDVTQNFNETQALPSEELMQNRIIYCIADLAVISFSCYLLYRRTKNKNINFYISHLRPSVFFLVIGSVIILITTLGIDRDTKLFQFLLGIDIFIFFIMTIYAVYQLLRAKSNENKLEEQLAAQVEFYKQMEQKNEGIYRIRHDYINNIQCATDLLQRDKPEDALKYLSDIGTEIMDTRQEYYSGNVFLDGILSNKQQMAREADTQLVFSGDFPANGIKYSDICAIVANALDNAVEACEKIDGKCTISMTSRIISDRVYVRIVNPVLKMEKKKGGRIETTKADKSSHGFGTLIMKKAAEKYGGSVKQEFLNDGTFELVFDLKYC